MTNFTPSWNYPNSFEPTSRNSTFPRQFRQDIGINMHSYLGNSTWFQKVSTFCSKPDSNTQTKIGDKEQDCYKNDHHKTDSDEFQKYEEKHDIEVKESTHELEEFWLSRCENTSENDHESRVLNDADRQIVKVPSRTSWHGFNTNSEERAIKPSLVFTKRQQSDQTSVNNQIRRA